MTSKKSNSPVSLRKSPRQDRSKGLVDSVLSAAARVFKESGFDASTTNRIAEIAGVSIGSLYQYFPNKDALLAALIDHQIQRNIDQVQSRIEAAAGMSLNEKVDHLVDSAFEIFVSDRPFLRSVFREISRVGRVEATISARKRGIERIAEALATHAPELGGRDPHLVAFIIVNAIMGVVDVLILDEESASRHDASVVRDQLRALLRGYLVGGATGA